MGTCRTEKIINLQKVIRVSNERGGPEPAPKNRKQKIAMVACDAKEWRQAFRPERSAGFSILPAQLWHRP